MKDKVLAVLLLLLSICGIILSFLPSNLKNKSDDGGIKSFTVSGDKILSLQLNGVLMDGGTQSFIGTDLSESVKVRDQLIKAAKDKSVKGVLIRINSPGGAVGISQEIYQAVKKVRAKKPVITSMGDVAASGGYYIAAGSDFIYANPGTLTGSIGVISHFTNLEGIYGKVGVKDMTIKAGKYKDIGSGTRAMTEEEKAILQNLVNDTYDQFINDVYEGRRSNSSQYGEARKNLTREYVQQVAQGMIYTGRQAKQIGLVDQLGNYNDALEELQKIVKKKSKGKIRDDLTVVESLGNGSIKELIGLSSGLVKLKAGSSIFGPLQDTLIGHSKNPVMLLAPEFVSMP
jgi:protease IV